MSKKTDEKNEFEQKISELTLDLQRTRADFENYRKRVESEKEQARAAGKSAAILKLLPIVDTIERAISHQPEELKDNAWAQGVTALVKNLEKSLEALDLHRIEATPGTEFNPELHEAIQFDDEAEGEKEVIVEELQPGYKQGNLVLRHSMVKVGRE
jgi:molecular chaperone GrpE